MKMKRGKFFTFLFSLIPGAGEMYLGFFKFGTSLMSLFIGSMICGSIFSPLILIAFVVWFYSFFHTNNLNHMPDQEFEKLEDTYLFPFFNNNSLGDFIHSHKTLCSVGCIFIGIMILFYTLIDAFLLMIPDELFYEASHIFHTFVPKIFFGIICVLAGFLLIRGKKISLLQELEKDIDDFDNPYIAEEYPEWTETIMKPNNSEQTVQTEQRTYAEQSEQAHSCIEEIELIKLKKQTINKEVN